MIKNIHLIFFIIIFSGISTCFSMKRSADNSEDKKNELIRATLEVSKATRETTDAVHQLNLKVENMINNLAAINSMTRKTLEETKESK